MLDSSHHRAKSEERRAAEHGSALQKADPASRSVHAMRGCMLQRQPRLAPTRATIRCCRCTSCAGASVESSHARLIPSSREERRAKSEERRAAEHGSALQKADPASRSVHAMCGCMLQCQPRLAPTRTRTSCGRSTPCGDVSVESSHARLIPSSREERRAKSEEQPSMARLYRRQIPRADPSTPCVDGCSRRTRGITPRIRPASPGTTPRTTPAGTPASAPYPRSDHP
ncbi:hypothetical protein IMCGPPIG_00355 [Stenotrophomonas maltophilia]|nr:hypothetical protein PLCFDHLH_00423 [Stenotrophomonas maltophilia]QNG89170.1 hypothetical protein IMCGPPIG_00355 [Stenotrophomonas maltophilia]